MHPVHAIAPTATTTTDLLPSEGAHQAAVALAACWRSDNPNHRAHALEALIANGRTVYGLVLLLSTALELGDAARGELLECLCSVLDTGQEG